LVDLRREHSFAKYLPGAPKVFWAKCFLCAPCRPWGAGNKAAATAAAPVAAPHSTRRPSEGSSRGRLNRNDAAGDRQGIDIRGSRLWYNGEPGNSLPRDGACRVDAVCRGSVKGGGGPPLPGMALLEPVLRAEPACGRCPAARPAMRGAWTAQNLPRLTSEATCAKLRHRRELRERAAREGQWGRRASVSGARGAGSGEARHRLRGTKCYQNVSPPLVARRGARSVSVE
jgi:hypothetical protein